MTLKMCKMWSNGIKTTFFFQKIWPPAARGSAPRPSSGLEAPPPDLSSLPHQKIPLSKFLMTLLHVICGLASPPIKNPGHAYDSGSRFSTCFFFQLLSATGSYRFLTNVCSSLYHMLSSIKHSNIIAKYSNIFCNNTSILKAIAESLR